MPSSNLSIDKRRRTYIRLLGEIKHALNQALCEEFKSRRLTRKKMSETLGVDKSFISKKMSGEGNMTLETLADLAYALDRPIQVLLPSRHGAAGSNVSSHAASGSPVVTLSTGDRNLYTLSTGGTQSATLSPVLTYQAAA